MGKPFVMLACAAPALMLAACAGLDPAASARLSPLAGVVTERAPAYYDGEADDLLTGGLGMAGLAAPTAPEGASLRTRALHNNIRALIDLTSAGELPKIAGTEYLALLRIDGLADPVAAAVDIPDDFDPAAPCLVVAPSSGSRGVYGAAGPVGSLALPAGCALAYTDKATGTGFTHLATGEGYDAGLALTGDTEEMLFAAEADPNAPAGAVAVKHAHSRDNVERAWGAATLAAAEYGLDVMSRHFETAFAPEDTLVLAVSISNGGRAVLAAAEQDRAGLIDGVVASEPNVAVREPGTVRIGGETVEGAGRTLYDYATQANLFAPCAALAPSLASMPGANFTAMARPALSAWCEKLSEAGLVEGGAPEAWGEAALAELRAYGFLAETDPLLHYAVATKLWPAIVVAYANAYGRYAVGEGPCGAYYAFAGADGAPRAPSESEKAVLAAVSGGVPPTGGVEILYKDKNPGAAFDAALCLRTLLTGEDGAALRAGLDETLMSADLGDVPAIVLHGRADGLIPVSHASRAYAAAARGAAPLRYYEIEAGQHFDAFLMAPDMAARFEPMHEHVAEAFALMLAHLKTGADLPPSQVVRRGRALRPAPEADEIEVAGGVVSVPQ